MPTSLVDADLILALDIGTISTRAILFDVVEGRYRFLGAGTSPTTANAPVGDISEGVRLALDRLEEVTGRRLIGPDGQLAIPALPDGTGVDACVATVSVGPPIRVVAIGLLEDISTESARNLATTTYAEVVETFSLNDKRMTAARLDTLLSLRPDLVVVAGGAEGGATESVINLLESVGLACYILPKDLRPEVLFAGNSALIKPVKETLAGLASLHIAPNVRPSLDIEQLTPAQPALSQVFRQVRARQMRGIAEIDRWTGNRLTPAATAFGRTIRFISKEYAHTHKGVLGIDVGASSTTVAAGFLGDLTLSIHTQLGLGLNLPQMLRLCKLEDIQRWLPIEIPNHELLDYMHNKAAYPGSLPASPTELGNYASSGGSLEDVFVNGQYAYLLEGTGLRVMDISNPQRPIEVGDYRPGMEAARELGIRSPLLEAGLTKADIREVSRHFDVGIEVLSGRVHVGPGIRAVAGG